MSWWDNLSDGQGVVVAAVIGIISTAGAAILGWKGAPKVRERIYNRERTERGLVNADLMRQLERLLDDRREMVDSLSERVRDLERLDGSRVLRIQSLESQGDIYQRRIAELEKAGERCEAENARLRERISRLENTR